jgi:hypothetical protein
LYSGFAVFLIRFRRVGCPEGFPSLLIDRPREIHAAKVLEYPLNRDVPPARTGEFGPLSYGPLRVDPPVVLAPMAGVTNAPFRRLCRSFGAGLYVSEMITARALVEGNARTRRLAEFAARGLDIGIYGGDAIVAPDGSLSIIDLNDWPSFAPCRGAAAYAIARHVVAEERRAQAVRS